MNPGTENNPTVSTRTLLLRFRVTGPVCYLSHQETLTFWQRFLIRCGLPLVYRGGFNPRPRLSLPLPRAVGLQSEDDLLAVKVEATEATDDLAALAARMNALLPEGIEIFQITAAEGKPALEPVSAVYRWTRHPDFPVERWRAGWRARREQLGAGEPIFLHRESPKGGGKTFDLAAYLLDLEGDDDSIQARCAVTGEGTVRIDELMHWLGLEAGDLAEPVRRISVEWNTN